jgi:hypothetical protein
MPDVLKASSIVTEEGGCHSRVCSGRTEVHWRVRGSAIAGTPFISAELTRSVTSAVLVGAHIGKGFLRGKAKMKCQASYKHAILQYESIKIVRGQITNVDEFL